MSTPASIATKLRAAGWTQLPDGDTWQRPGPHPDVHTWPVADLIRRTGEPHHDLPATYGVHVERPKYRPKGAPRKTDLIHEVAAMRDVQGMTFQAIADKIGGTGTRARYLYQQKAKIASVAASP